jgi:biotin operon repressor
VLKANHEPKKWRGVTIERGQFYTSLDVLSKELSLSVQKIRTAISKLESTGEITSKQHARARMITVINYDQHQADNKEITRNQQGSNKEVTTTKKNKNNKNEKNTKDITNPASDNADGLEPYYITRKKRKLTGKRLETFNMFWDAFDYRKDKSSAADSWLNIPSLTDSLVDEIVSAAKVAASARGAIIAGGKSAQYAQGWLTAKRWEDEHIEQEQSRSQSRSEQKSFAEINAEAKKEIYRKNRKNMLW